MKIEVYSPTIRRKEMDAVLTALVEDRIGPGEQAKLLVQIAREKLKFDFCLALRSPVAALFLALEALNLEDGEGVIISALSPLYYARVIEKLRLVPLYADTAPSSCLPGRETIEKAIAGKAEGFNVRAIVLHHTLGFTPDTAAIAELGLPIIEDISQGYGAMAGEFPVGQGAQNTALLSILGFEERDMLTAGGGALLYAGSRRSGSALRNQSEGLPPEYGLPDMNAAMGIVQFREAGKNLEKRRDIAGVYTQSAMRTRHKRFAQEEYNNYAFPLILETGMKDVKAYAKKKDIAVESAFERTPVALGLASGGACPEAYSLSLRTALFPIYPRLSSSEVEKVSKLIMTLP
jgi:dTDP-4-amino-4,6-dideoxygalactose transaminase